MDTGVDCRIGIIAALKIAAARGICPFDICAWPGCDSVCWPLPLETSTEHSAKSEGMICPIALSRGRGCHPLNTPAQPKHDVPSGVAS
jgi:hypothetical protein